MFVVFMRTLFSVKEYLCIVCGGIEIKNRGINMNMSLITNIVALVLIGVGYISPFAGAHIRTVGFFALSGAITNWLAVYMLFEKVPLLYGSGVVPNHFEDFKSGIRNLIMEQFFTTENMEKFLSDGGDNVDLSIDAEKIADAISYEKAFNSLMTVISESSIGGMLNMFGGAAVLKGFKGPFEVALRTFIIEEVSSSEIQEALASSVEMNKTKISKGLMEKVDVIVASRLDELTPTLVKEIVQQMIAKHLGWLVVWGGVFGGMIGLVMSFVQIL